MLEQDSADLAKKDRGYTAVNYNTDYDYGGSSGFQTGSTYKLIGSKTELYKRIGNSICVSMVDAISKEIKKQLF